MRLNVRFSTALWIGLAWVGSAGPLLAEPVTDPVRAHADGSATDPATGVSAAPLTPSEERQARPDFSGHWVFNAKASDDPQEKVKEAMKAMQQAQGGGRGMGGGSGRQGRGGGMGGGRQGHGSPGGMGGRSEMPAGEMSALTATPERLDITHEDPMLLIADGNDQHRKIFTDFRGASVSISDGPQQRVAVAGWEGAMLVAETTMNGGTKLIQRYQIDAETGQLMISSAAQLSGLQEVAFRLVYDRIKPGMDAESR